MTATHTHRTAQGKAAYVNALISRHSAGDRRVYEQLIDFARFNEQWAQKETETELEYLARCGELEFFKGEVGLTMDQAMYNEMMGRTAHETEAIAANVSGMAVIKERFVEALVSAYRAGDFSFFQTLENTLEREESPSALSHWRRLEGESNEAWLRRGAALDFEDGHRQAAMAQDLYDGLLHHEAVSVACALDNMEFGEEQKGDEVAPAAITATELLYFAYLAYIKLNKQNEKRYDSAEVAKLFTSGLPAHQILSAIGALKVNPESHSLPFNASLYSSSTELTATVRTASLAVGGIADLTLHFVVEDNQVQLREFLLVSGAMPQEGVEDQDIILRLQHRPDIELLSVVYNPEALQDGQWAELSEVLQTYLITECFTRRGEQQMNYALALLSPL